MFDLAAFYRFVPIDDPGSLRESIINACSDHGIKGTILLASEGINGTIAGSAEGVDAVLAHLRTIRGLEDLEAKRASADSDPFYRLKVRVKREIVSLGVGEVDTARHTGTHVPPETWNELIQDPDVIVIDARNDYEVAIGSFDGAINPGTRSFTGFPEWVASNERLASHPRIAMFCTGGIRCEKASAWLKEQGFTDVFQLEGGILNYLEQVPSDESLWSGECYVFDRRVSVGHGLVPGTNEICPNCNRVVGDDDRGIPGYQRGVTCPACHDEITPDRRARFAERQHQIALAQERGTAHLGRPA
jgi:UPF0176 protein